MSKRVIMGVVENGIFSKIVIPALMKNGESFLGKIIKEALKNSNTRRSAELARG